MTHSCIPRTAALGAIDRLHTRAIRRGRPVLVLFWLADCVSWRARRRGGRSRGLPLPARRLHADRRQAVLPSGHVLRPLRRRRCLGRASAGLLTAPPAACGVGSSLWLLGRSSRSAAHPSRPARKRRNPTVPGNGSVNKDLSATIGWPYLVAQMAAVTDTTPAKRATHLVVFTGDYGAAGAIDLYGARDGLPLAISGHNTYWWWGPRGEDDSTTIAVTLPAPTSSTIFSKVQRAPDQWQTPHKCGRRSAGIPSSSARTEGGVVAAWPSAKHYG